MSGGNGPRSGSAAIFGLAWSAMLRQCTRPAARRPANAARCQASYMTKEGSVAQMRADTLLGGGTVSPSKTRVPTPRVVRAPAVEPDLSAAANGCGGDMLMASELQWGPGRATLTRLARRTFALGRGFPIWRTGYRQQLFTGTCILVRMVAEQTPRHTKAFSRLIGRCCELRGLSYPVGPRVLPAVTVFQGAAMLRRGGWSSNA